MYWLNRLMVAIAGAIACGACAGTPGQQETLEQKLASQKFRLGEPVQRIQKWRLDSWVYLDRLHVIMRTAPSTYFLVSLKTPCRGLSTTETIAFTTTSSQLTTFDKLVVKESGGLIEQCYIDALHRLKKVNENLSS
jgi:hypothetical protein